MSSTCPNCDSPVERVEEGGAEHDEWGREMHVLPTVAYFECGRVEVDGSAEQGADPKSCDAIAALRAEVERLTGLNGDYIRKWQQEQRSADKFAGELGRAEAEVKRLRRERDEARDKSLQYGRALKAEAEVERLTSQQDEANRVMDELCDALEPMTGYVPDLVRGLRERAERAEAEAEALRKRIENQTPEQSGAMSDNPDRGGDDE